VEVEICGKVGGGPKGEGSEIDCRASTLWRRRVEWRGGDGLSAAVTKVTSKSGRLVVMDEGCRPSDRKDSDCSVAST